MNKKERGRTFGVISCWILLRGCLTNSGFGRKQRRRRRSKKALEEVRNDSCGKKGGVMNPGADGTLLSCANIARQYTDRTPGDICNNPEARPAPNKCDGPSPVTLVTGNKIKGIPPKPF